MNEFLAELYGTREMIGTEDTSDVEKLAEAQILDSMLQSEGINVDQIDDDTILKLAHEIFGDDSELVKSAMKDEEGEGGKKCEDCGKADCECAGDSEGSGDAEKNAADADLMGRIMAHSMVNELNEIEKDAGAKTEAVKATAKKGYEGAKNLFGRLKGKAGETAGKAKSKATAPGRTFKHVRSEEGASVPKALFETARAHKGATGAALGTAAAAGGAGTALALKGKKKAASAIDTLAEQRALEILAENGIEPGGETEETKLASAVERRAFEMLAEAGYVSEE